MELPPCTEGKHSTTDLPPKIEKKEAADPTLLSNASFPAPPPRAPITVAQTAATPPPPPPESEDDDPSLEIADGQACRRRGCGARYSKGQNRDGEECTHHPGAPIFHEGSKGYSCCKRRVLEFDQFMKIEGCKTKPRHLFVGSGKKDASGNAIGSGGEELLETVRYVTCPACWEASLISFAFVVSQPSSLTRRRWRAGLGVVNEPRLRASVFC